MPSPSSLKAQFFPEVQFGGFTRVDGTVAFYSRVQALLQPHMILVDFGCGRGAYQDDSLAFRRELRIFRGKARRVIGLDVSDSGKNNPFLDEFLSLPPGSAPWPLADASADMIVSDQVLEHLPEPDQFFHEARRVLRPGGYLCLRTPNRWSYVALGSRLVPNRAHSQVLGRLKTGLRDEDVFPTYYRCNTLPAIKRALKKHGFQSAVYAIEPEPGYLSFSALAYRLGLAYQRLAPEWLRSVLLAFGFVPAGED